LGAEKGQTDLPEGISSNLFSTYCNKIVLKILFLGIEAGLISKCFDLVGVGINGGGAAWLGGIDFSPYSITITKFASKTDNLKERLQIVVEFTKKAGKQRRRLYLP
jgi:hypothetical protein